jgi:hypothetical protein
MMKINDFSLILQGLLPKLKSYNFEHNPLVFCDDFPFPHGVLETRSDVETLLKYIRGKTITLRRYGGGGLT